MSTAAAGYLYLDAYQGLTCSGAPIYSNGYALNRCYTAFNSTGSILGSIDFECGGECDNRKSRAQYARIFSHH